MFKKIYLTSVAVIICGCTSFAERCTNEGYTQGTPAFTYCVAEKRQQADEALMLMSAGISTMGAGIQQSYQQQPAIQYYQPRTTNCYPIGTMQVQCRSY